jgi:ATP-binding cassette subfamily B protein
MSEEKKPMENATANGASNGEKERLNTRGEFSGRRMGPGGGGPGRGPGQFLPGEKAKDFKGTTVRLVQYLRPHWFGLIFIITATIFATLLNVYAPKVRRAGDRYDFRGIKANGRVGRFYCRAFDLNHFAYPLCWNAVLLYGQHWLMTGISQKIVRTMRG